METLSVECKHLNGWNIEWMSLGKISSIQMLSQLFFSPRHRDILEIWCSNVECNRGEVKTAPMSWLNMAVGDLL
jgi:hypothetical protein